MLGAKHSAISFWGPLLCRGPGCWSRVGRCACGMGWGCGPETESISVCAYNEHRYHRNPVERQPRAWPAQANEYFPLIACRDPAKLCWFPSVGEAGAVAELIHHPVPLRQMDKDPCVCQDKPSGQRHPQHLPACNRWGVLRPKPQNLDLQGGQLLNLGLAVFPLWSGAPLERSGHLKPYLHPKNTVSICLLLWASSAGQKDKQRI